MRGRLNRVGWWAAVGLLAPLLAPLAAVAGDNSWNNSAGGLWQDADNWSAGAAPSDAFTTIWITNSPAKTVTIDHNTAAIPGVMTITNLTLFAPSGSVNTLLVANANDGGNPLRILKTLTVGTNAALSVTNSTIVTGGLSFYVDGSAKLETGALLNATGAIATAYVGYNSPASLALAGGVLIDSDAYLGSLNVRASNCTALISGAGTIWSNRNYFYLGYWSANNTITINQGGAIRSDSFWGGVMPGASNNSITVTGTGSVWTNKNDVMLGFAGVGNQLTLADGGALYGARGFLGSLNYSRGNTALVTGAGSVWGCNSNLTIGYGFGNSLTITNGGTVYNSDASIGDTGSNNTVTVTGSGSVWNNRANLYLGRTGRDNTLSVGNGGAVHANRGYLGYETNACHNAVTVSGSGSVWSNRNDLHIGWCGLSNTLSLTGSGAVYNATGYVGHNTNANCNAVVVDGAGCVWSNGGDFLYIGYAGAGNFLTLTNGGQVSAPASLIGYRRSASNNTAIVTGAGSVWKNTSTYLYVGWSGSGNTLTISNGGAVLDPTGIIGGVPLACNNAAVVTGAGSIWSNSAPLHVGQHGAANTLTLADGGTACSTWGYLGYEADASNNTVTVTGPASAWNCATNLYLAFYGHGNSLAIAGGGSVRNAQGVVGISTNASNNSVTVAGPGSLWTNREWLALGFSGAGNTLSVSDGGAVCNTEGVVGYDYSAGNNAATVSGQGSTWSNSGWLAIGLLGSGNTLSILDGGVVHDTEGDIGCDASAAANAVTVAGPGSVWDNGEGLYVGAAGPGNTLTITNGGTVLAPTTFVGADLSSSNTLVTIAEGSLIATNASHTGILQVEHGSVILHSGLVQADCLAVTNADAHFIKLGGALLLGACLNLPPSLDADADGLPNGWEQGYGLDPLDPTENNGPDGDPDGDGFTNWQEYLAGTDPTGVCPPPRIVSIATADSDIVITWQTTGGKTNVVQASESVGGTYTDLSPNLLIPGTGDTTTNWLDPGAISTWPARFYRIRLVP